MEAASWHSAILAEMSPSNLARVLAVTAFAVLAAASASSSQNNNQNASMMPQYGQPQGGGPPAPQQMEPGRVLGLWRSTFGAVKIEADNSKGGLQSGSVQGVWVYNRQGQEVIGYFAGNLRGNVLQFRWNEPGAQGGPPLNGEGWLQFGSDGRQYSGRWWTDRRDRVGDWNGWRQPGEGDPYTDQQPPANGAYGGNTYGADPYARPPAPPPPSSPSSPSSPPSAPPSDRRYY
jgi:hypothetical protein